MSTPLIVSVSKRIHILPIIFVISAYSLIINSPAQAQWAPEGNVISTAPGSQKVYGPMCSDGIGGAFITWSDQNYPSSDVFLNRIDAFGRIQWPTDLRLSSGVGYNVAPVIIADGFGCAIIAWQDVRGVDIDVYAQKIDRQGINLWWNGGYPVCNATGDQQIDAVIPDQNGGAIFIWTDTRSGGADIYAQRVDYQSVSVWSPYNGVVVTAQTGNQLGSFAIPDGLGGAIIGWYESAGTDLYVSRLDSDGIQYWGFYGSRISSLTTISGSARVIPDGHGGAIFAWSDSRTDTGDIYAQHMDANGLESWTIYGIPLISGINSQILGDFVADDIGGGYLVWRDDRAGPSDIRAQRIDSNGTGTWGIDGTLVCGASDYQTFPKATRAEYGGLIVTWIDNRSSVNRDIYVQKLDGLGTPLWTTDGNPVANWPADQDSPLILSDATGGAFISYTDWRLADRLDLYTQRIDRNGYLGYPGPWIDQIQDVPGDQGGVVNISWSASRLDTWGTAGIYSYSVWRSLPAVLAKAAQSRGAVLLGDLREISGIGLEQTVLINGTTADKTYYWERVGIQDAVQIGTYSLTVPTLYDSTLAATRPQVFQVMAQGYVDAWVSAPDSGISVDNLSPLGLKTLAAFRNGSNVELDWLPDPKDPDLDHYVIYRSLISGFIPSPATRFTSTTILHWVDTGADPASAFYYKVSAVDVHGNEGPATLEVIGDIVSGVSDFGNHPTVLTLLPNGPNPFGTGTNIRLGLPQSSDVKLEIYDLAGRRLATRIWRDIPAGWQTLSLQDEKASLASGIYLYRVQADGQTSTGKLTMAH